MNYRVFSSTLSLFQVDGNSTLPSCNYRKCLNTLSYVPMRTKLPLVKKHLSTKHWDTV